MRVPRKAHHINVGVDTIVMPECTQYLLFEGSQCALLVLHRQFLDKVLNHYINYLKLIILGCRDYVLPFLPFTISIISEYIQ